MSSMTYLAQLLPELMVGLGACLLLVFGVGTQAPARILAAPVSMAAIILALVATVMRGPSVLETGAPGLLFTSLTYYVRIITLGMGAILLLVNWHVPERTERSEYFTMLLLSLTGVMLTASANDLVVLFFAIELVSVPTYIMVALSRQDVRAPESAVKYFFLGAMSAGVMLYGFSFLYGVAGTTVLHAEHGPTIGAFLTGSTAWTGFAVTGLLLSLGGLCFKIAAVPFHAYAADVYEGAASPVTGFLGFVPKFAGFVALVKLLALAQWSIPDSMTWLLWLIAAATMTVGNVVALLQSNVKRMLAYSSIAHSGYMLIGLLVGPGQGGGPMRNGVAALLFYMTVYGTMNLGAFAVLAALKVRGDEIDQIDDLSGLHRRHPAAALALAVCVFSLMGFPLTAGFMGKVYIFGSAMSLGMAHPFGTPLLVLAVIGVINSAIGAVYYLRIAATCYLREPGPSVEQDRAISLQWAWTTCAVLMLVWFLWPTGLVSRARDATAFVAKVQAINQPSLARVGN